MKKILICLFAFGSLLCGSCSDWLEVYPKNEQITANYWKAKEDVEAVLASGYSSLRACTRTLVDWGELRGASIYAYSDTKKTEIAKFPNYSFRRFMQLGIHIQNTEYGQFCD